MLKAGCKEALFNNEMLQASIDKIKKTVKIHIAQCFTLNITKINMFLALHIHYNKGRIILASNKYLTSSKFNFVVHITAAFIYKS